MSTDKNRNGSSTNKSWAWMMLMVTVVFMLLLITTGIISIKGRDVLPENTDILFVVGKKPSFDIEDDEGKGWSSDRRIPIFKSEYVNGKGETTVVSQDGDRIFAPGTITEYVFTYVNEGNMAIAYQTDLNFVLSIDSIAVDATDFPVKVRLTNGNGEYLIGTETEYVQIKKATLNYHPGILGASSYENFTLEILWEYEGGNDELDTWLGDQAVDQNVTLNLNIRNYAEQASDPTQQGGTKYQGTDSEEYGGTTRYPWLILLMVCTALLIIYTAWLVIRQTKYKKPSSKKSSSKKTINKKPKKIK